MKPPRECFKCDQLAVFVQRTTSTVELVTLQSGEGWRSYSTRINTGEMLLCEEHAVVPS